MHDRIGFELVRELLEVFLGQVAVEPELVDRAPAKIFRAVIAVNRFHHAHLPVARAAPLFITNASDWRENLFLCSAFRTRKFVHDVPAELHHHVLRSQIHCAALT